MLYYACGLEGKLKIKGKYIFTSSLLGTTIQDGGIRERSSILLFSSLLFLFFSVLFLAVSLFSDPLPLTTPIFIFVNSTV